MKTNQKILNFLSHHSSCSVSEISHAMGLTKADIRYHIAQLLKEEKISVFPPDENLQQIGRPAQRYQYFNIPSQNSLSAFLEILCNSLISQRLVKDLCQDIWENAFAKNNTPITPLSRIEFSVAFLKRIGVEAIWIAGKNGPLLQIVNNPYSERYPQSCQEIVDTLIQKATKFAEGN